MRIGLVGNPQGIGGIGRYGVELIKTLKERGIDIKVIWKDVPSQLATFSRLSDFFRALCLAPTTLRETRGCDVVHALAGNGCVAFPLIRIPKIVTIHDCVQLNRKWLSPRIYGEMYYFAESSALFSFMRWSDIFIAVSNKTREELIGLGFPREKVKVVYEGVGEEFKRLGCPERKKFVLGYVGGLTYRKGVDYILKSFRHFLDEYGKDSELVICGNGKELGYLSQLARELGVKDKVIFKGFVEEKELAKTYNSFDVFLFGSHYEGVGLPILESQRCAVPVIIRKDASIDEKVAKACIKVGSPEEMAKMACVLATDETAKNKVVEEGLKHARRFTWKQTAEETVKIYEEIA